MHEPMCAPATAPDLRKDFDNLLDLIRMRAEHHAHKPAYVFLADGEDMEETLGFGHLDLRARAIAAYLQQRMAPGSRVLLLYPAGLDYIAAFLGCLYAGVVAVPAYPPNRHHGQRLRSVVQDAQPAAVLSVSGLAERLQSESADWAGSAQWLLTDAVDEAEARAWRPPELDHASLAFLQYTSGSTGSPKGVMVSHGNLLANQEVIRRAFGHDAESTVVGWLPFYHDMGLIGNVLQPLCVGATAVLMPPLRFLEKPLRWLQAVSRYRAHTSGGPNFAYELCIRKIAEADKAGLDLRHWRVAFNGAEPVRADTLRRFGAAFAGCGFRPEAHFPCYGLAESTLFVTGPAKGQGACFVVPTTDSAKRVGCGSTGDGHAARIVDPASGAPRPEGAEGEIWIAGPSVADGYWNRPAESEHTFRARLPGDERYWLRSGDLGLLHQGQLVVTGRIKDLIIVRGRNFYPHDIEQALDRIDGLRPGCAVAFGTEIDGDEGLVVVAEARRPRLAEGEAQALRDVIRAAVAAVCDAPLAAIALVPPGAVPKTSSGKLQRSECRRRYEAGELPILTSTDSGLAEPAIDLLGAALRALPAEQRAPLLQSWLVDRAAQVLKTNPATVQAAPTLASLGLHSLQALELKHAVDQLLGCDAPLDWFLADLDLVELAARVAGADAVAAGAPPAPPEAVAPAQRAMWTVQRLDPSGVVYNLHLALQLEGAFDSRRFAKALDEVMARHPALRDGFRQEADGRLTRFAGSTDACSRAWSEVDATGWDEKRLSESLRSAVRTPFDLAQPPLFRLCFYRLGPYRGMLLAVAHHILIDLWSLLIVLRDLGAAYAGQPLTPAVRGFESHLGGLNAYLDSPASERDWDWWRERLSGELPSLALATDRPRPALPDYRGASVALRLDAALAERLQAVARKQGCSLFVLLLAAYQVLLHRYSGQDDLIVGVPYGQRDDASLADTVGHLVNPLPLRSAFHPRRPFAQFLAETRSGLAAALRHGRFPFAKLVERLNPNRTAGQWPVYQTWFVLQQAQGNVDGQWAQLGVGEPGQSFPWQDWQVRVAALPERVEMFDLRLMAAEADDGLLLSFAYRCELFDRVRIEEMASCYALILHAVADRVECPIGALRWMDDAGRSRVLEGWNDTVADYGPYAPVHALIARQARQTPEAEAIRFGERALAYGEMESRANGIAQRLARLGAAPERIVAVCLRRSLELPLILLAILKSGVAYLPLDADQPDERLQRILEDAAPLCLIADDDVVPRLAPLASMPLQALSDLCRAEPRDTPPAVAVAPGHPAYVLYTSGSTGTPKGVVIPHAGLANRLLWMQAYFGLDERDAVLQKTPYTFDVSVWEFFWPWLAGARLVVAEPGAHLDPHRLRGLIEAQGVTTVHFVPAMLEVFVESMPPGACSCLRRIVASGEALLQAQVDHCADKIAAPLYNLYGPTEASIDVTVCRALPESGGTAVSIGSPIANTRVYVLDRGFEPVPAGVAGDLYLAGVQLARGYLHRPDLTAAGFLPDPHGVPGTRMYRTGDLARWNRDGSLEFLGRSDFQVKIRGLRIEPREIEQTLLGHPAVGRAVVAAQADGHGTRHLVAYVSPRAGASPDSDALRPYLSERLPEYFVPSFYVFLDQLPLTPSGKIDRRALPAPDLAKPQQTYAPPRDDTEAMLTALWAEVLHVERVGIHDNFFDLGGDSIRSIQMSSRAHGLGWQIEPRAVFQHQTVAELAAVVEALAEAPSAPDAPLGEPFTLATLRAEEMAALRARYSELEDVYPCAPMQEGLLFHTLMYPQSGMYLMQDRYRIEGTVDVEAFRAAWQAVTDHHPILRTAFVWDVEGAPHQLVVRHVEVPFLFEDWRDIPAALQERRFEQLLAEEREAGFDFGSPPLLRIRLFRVGEQDWRFVRSYHHILLDEWCTSEILSHFKSEYAARIQNDAPPIWNAPLFRAYLEWIQRQDKDAARAYWRGRLENFDSPTEIGVARQIGESAEAAMVADVCEELSADETRRLHAVAGQMRTTPNTVAQAAWALLLGRYSGRHDVLFGVTVAGRPVALPGADRILGLFINSLPLRVSVTPEQTAREFLQSLLQHNLELRSHEYLPLTELQGYTGVPHGQELFHSLFVYENAPVDPELRTDHRLFHLRYEGNRTHTNYPLTVVVIPGERLRLQITYQKLRFPEESMRRMLAHFRNLLLGLVEQPGSNLSQLAMQDPSEATQLRAWNGVDEPWEAPDDWMALFAARVAAHPDRIAAACDGVCIRYGALHERANRVANALRASGAGWETPVLVVGERGLEFLTVLLGVLKAGAVYVPFDPAYPRSRLLQILRESKARFVVASAAERPLLSEALAEAGLAEVRVYDWSTLAAHPDATEPPSLLRPDNLAYVLYTSGSTGTPKGAMVTHAGLRNNLLSKISALDLTERDAIAQTASQGFDISVWQFLTALLCGARIEIFGDAHTRNPEVLGSLLVAREVTVLEIVPTLMQALLDELPDSTDLGRLRWLIPTGEAFPAELCRRWQARFPRVCLLNAYGPAECADDVAYYFVPPELPGLPVVPIGRPLPNVRLHVLDHWLDRAPVGVPGELCISGVGVGRGYLARADLTAERFLPDPFAEVPGSRLYRTGDLARWREDGVLEFLGRIDHQVKIRGHRIELGEIENRLLQHPTVGEAVVTVWGEGAGAQLVAHVTAHGAEWVDPQALRAQLHKALPEYCVPHRIVLLEAMPRTPNGKVDRKALPRPDADPATSRVAPRNPTEVVLAGIWCEVLGITASGVLDHFHDLGGHSLAAMQVISRVRRGFEVEVTLQEFFLEPTIEHLALVVEEKLIEKILETAPPARMA